MLRSAYPIQTELEMVTLESLVPKDHLLRFIDRHISFDFIRAECESLYCPNNGRPALDPVMLFKMLFVGYLFGVRSERRLIKEIEVSANKRHFELVQVEQTPAAYLAELDAAVDAERAMAGQKPLRRDKGKPEDDEDPDGDRPAPVSGADSASVPAPETDTREIKRSTVDPDAGFMVRDQKPVGFFYLDHRTVDGVHALILDTHVTPGNVNDATPYLDRLDRTRARFGLEVGAVGLDAGYFTPWVCKGILERGLYGVMGYRRPTHREGYFHKREYAYDAQTDRYRCPADQIIFYRGTNRNGYREHASDPKQCQHCPPRTQCTQSKNHQKLITRHVWHHFKEQIDANRLTDLGKRPGRTPQGNGLAQLCRCRGAAWALLCPLQRFGQSTGAVLALGGVSEHEENGLGPRPQGQERGRGGSLTSLPCPQKRSSRLQNRRMAENAFPLLVALRTTKPLLRRQKNKTPRISRGSSAV